MNNQTAIIKLLPSLEIAGCINELLRELQSRGDHILDYPDKVSSAQLDEEAKAQEEAEKTESAKITSVDISSMRRYFKK